MTEGPIPKGRLPRAMVEAAGLSDESKEALRALGVQDEHDLAFACRTNRIRDLPALGPDVQAALQRALRRTRWSVDARPLGGARRSAARVLDRLQRSEAALRLAVVGAVRRMEPWVDLVELLATAHEPQALLDAFREIPFLEDATIGGQVARARTADGTQIVLTVLPEDPARYGTQLVARTGDREHWEALITQAGARSMQLAADGLVGGGEPLGGSEAELYERLGVPFLPPELRHAGWSGAAPDGLLGMADVAGLVHLHSAAAAGVFPVEELARRVAHEGFRWAVVADRSPSAFPRGLGADALAAQRVAVDRQNSDPESVRMFLGVEARVLPEAGLDWSDGALALADLVIGVIEDPPPGSGDAGRASITARYLRAVSDPRVQILAHPRTESIGGPRAVPDWDAVLAAAVAAGTAFELSGETHRVPFDDAWHRAARLAGAQLVPTADAADLDGFDNVIGAVGAARRGGWTVAQVLPARSALAFSGWLAERTPA